MGDAQESARAIRTRAVTGVDDYDPFVRGRHPVGVRTIFVRDAARERDFPCEVWYPATVAHAGQDRAPETQDAFATPSGVTQTQMAVRDAAAEPGTYPLIIFSHPSGGGRRTATFLCTHLSSHGYVVAGVDHSEMIDGTLARQPGEIEDQTRSRWRVAIASRVPDVRALLDHLLQGKPWDSRVTIDRDRVGIVGHSFGGWTALAVNESDSRVSAVVALAPGGASHPKPGILPCTLTFAWGRDVPTLYLVAEDDACLPLAGMHELFDRTRASKRMVVLRRSDHMHFMDHVEEIHELVRTMPPPAPELTWLAKDMRPIAELCSGEQAHLFARGLTLCHMDAVLKQQEDAQRFLAGDIEAELTRRGVEVIDHALR